MAKRIGQIAVNLSANSAAFTRDLNKAQQNLRSNSARMNRSLSVLERSFGKIQRSSANMIRGMTSWRAVVGTLAGTAGLGTLIKNSLETADAIAKSADVIGIRTGALQEYQHAARLSGVDTELLNKSFSAFSKRVGEARQETGPLTSYLKKFDEQLLANIRNSSTIEQALDLVFKRMGSLSNAADRAALANAAFSRSGLKLVNMVKNGAGGLQSMREEAQQLGIVLGDVDLRKAEAANDAIEKFSRVIKTTFTQAVIDNADSLTASMGSLAKSLSAGAKALGAMDRWFDIIFGGKASTSITEMTLKGLRHDEKVLKRLMSTMEKRTEEYKDAAERLQRIQYSIGQWENRQRSMGIDTALKNFFDDVDTKVDALGSGSDSDGSGTEVTDQLSIQHKAWTSLKATSMEAIKKQNEQLAIQKELLQDSVIALSARNTVEGEHSLALKAAESRQAAEDMTKLSTAAEEAGGTIKGTFADAFDSASYSLTNFLLEGEKSFSRFVESVLTDLARIGLQKSISAGFDSVFAGIFHDGGMVGRDRVPVRNITPATFAGAPRLHDGLSGDEFPAILQRGETVLPRGVDPVSISVPITINGTADGHLQNRLRGEVEQTVRRVLQQELR